VGGKGNEGVAGFVRQLPGSIGYVELIYALQNKIAFGAVQNAAGSWVTASIDGVTEAAASVKQMPRTIVCRSRMRQAKMLIRFRASPICWFLRIRERGQ